MASSPTLGGAELGLARLSKARQGVVLCSRARHGGSAKLRWAQHGLRSLAELGKVYEARQG
eukprot:2947783-Pyramimonas_sp.AAC.1